MVGEAHELGFLFKRKLVTSRNVRVVFSRRFKSPRVAFSPHLHLVKVATPTRIEEVFAG